jgi:peptide chain release factor subunit 1
VDLLADPIAGLRSGAGALITVYVDRPTPGGMSALLTDLLKPVRQHAEGMARLVRKSVRTDTERIKDLAGRLEADGAPGYAIFASDLDDVFVLESLAHAVPSVSSLGPRPYLRPLRAAPRAMRAGVIVADRALTRLFVANDGMIDEIQPPLRAEIGKPNYGGFGGYDEPSVRAHADEESARMWRDGGGRLLESHLERGFDFLAIGAHEEASEEIARHLHPYLTRLHRATFIANPSTLTAVSLRAQLAELSLEIRRERQAALAGRVCDLAWSGGLAVLGVASTLKACNAQAVEAMVVAGSFSRPGVICNACGKLDRTGDTCPVCGASLFQVEDVVAAAMDATVAAGGSVHQLEVASTLDVEGVGALIRFPILH